MKLTVTQENLACALNIVSRVASTKTQLPILNNVLLRTEGKRLLIAATNLEIATTQYIGAKVEKPGAITIPAKLVSEFVTSLPKNQPIELYVSNNHLKINSDTYSSVINGIIANDFPELPTINEAASIQYSLNTDEFKQAVTQTIITSGNDMTRPTLTGVYWHSYKGYLYLVSTDGYRLSERRLIKTKSDISVIIPTSSLQEVLRVLNDNIEEIDILFDETQVRFRINDTEIVSRLIDGVFPDYRQLIPASSETSILVNKSDFMRVTKIAGLFARESGGSIIITADKEAGIISIHSIASQLGENTSKTPAEVSNSGQITLNSRYLSEALSVINGDIINLSFNGKISPCILKSTNKNTNYYHVIMPLKS
jgi:DNA polymerase-3 subunit beta